MIWQTDTEREMTSEEKKLTFLLRRTCGEMGIGLAPLKSFHETVQEIAEKSSTPALEELVRKNQSVKIEVVKRMNQIYITELWNRRIKENKLMRKI